MKKILFVDDDPNILDGFRRQLFRQFDVETAPGGAEGLLALEQPDDFAVVVADMRMPEMNGVEFLARVRECAPGVVRIMLTGNADQTTAVEAINSGSIFRFLNKPCPPERLIEALKAALRQYQLQETEKILLETTLNGSIGVLGEILAANDPKSFGQSQILRDRMRSLANYLNLEPAWVYEAAGSLAHIGLVTIPREVLLKVRVGHPLNPKEQDMIRRIPSAGANLLSQIPRLEEVCRIIHYQNKRFDGAGFPDDSTHGENLPLGSRMIHPLIQHLQLEAEGLTAKEAYEALRQRTGHYDPKILDAIAACFKIQLPPVGMDGKPSVPVTFAALRIGHNLVSDLVTKDDVLIVSKGNRITQALMMRLRNFAALSGIKEPIYVENHSWVLIQGGLAYSGIAKPANN